eukprot:jgi/Botrbrau1/3924/Bobra.0183s0144.1
MGQLDRAFKKESIDALKRIVHHDVQLSRAKNMRVKSVLTFRLLTPSLNNKGGNPDREYVEYFARITYPLSRLLKKTSVFHWMPECQTSFEQVKQCLASEPVLRAPNFNLPFTLTIDWSKTAICAVLSQPDPMKNIYGTNFDHPIAFASKTLKEAERN